MRYFEQGFDVEQAAATLRRGAVEGIECLQHAMVFDLDNLAEPPSYSAVRALLRLLEERGHVKHVEEGARYVYLPAVSRGEARKKALSHVVATFFGGSIEQAMLTLVESSRSKLSQEELRRLAQIAGGGGDSSRRGSAVGE